MKSKLKLLGSIMTLLLACFGAQAIVLFQDNFSEYNNGPLGTNVPTWFAPPGDPTYATNTEISISSGQVVINYGGTASVQAWAVFTNGIPGYSISLPTSGPGAGISNITNTCYYFPSNGPVAALYASFTVNVSSGFANNSSGDYFAMFINTNFNLHPRIYLCTNSVQTPGNYRLEINNNSSPSAGTNGVEVVSQDLVFGNTYYVVFKQVLATGLSTLWVSSSPLSLGEAGYNGSTNIAVSPTAAQSSVLLGGGITETDTSGTNVPSFTALCGFGFHTGSAYGPGAITVGNLICGTTFADVVSGTDGSNPPFIAIQPANTTNFVGTSATLSVVAGGDQDTISYQWYQVTGGVTNAVGGNSPTYTIPSLATGNAGTYYVAITNAAGNVTSASATLAVLTGSAIPTITTQPANTSATVDGTATFSVVASDSGAPMTYQWYGPSGLIANQTNSSLSLAAVTFAQAGSYSVHVSNANGTTNSASATLTVNNPATVTIAYLRSLLNTNYVVTNTTTLFNIVGTVTTWHDMTSAGSTEFYMQDATGGICVFWDDAPSSTNLPPAGAKVSVTAPMAQFDSLIEMEPVFGNPFQSVTVLSTNNPLPTPLPVPFDPTVINNPTNMVRQFGCMYMVASNVFMDTTSNSTFVAELNDVISNAFDTSKVYSEYVFLPTSTTAVSSNLLTFTNQSGQSFVIYYNSYCDYIGQPIPHGPCTIYGVMGQFDSTTPPPAYTNGYEFTPSRMADIVPAVSITNVISNIIRYGDLATNTFYANVLQPGETLTMSVVASDPGGGTVNVTTTPGMGTWSAVSGNGTPRASASYTLTATSLMDGTADNPMLTVTFSSSGAVVSYTNFSIYVPTPDEQNIRLMEVFASPTSNTNSPAHNPLQRSSPETTNANDEYIEIVNFNTVDSVALQHWTVYSGSAQEYEFVNGENLGPGTCGIVYGGDPNNAPNLFTSSMAFTPDAASGLNLSASGGTVSLYDNSGNLVDRIAYPASGSAILNPASFNDAGQTAANYPLGSFIRFPTLPPLNTLNGAVVPLAFVSTNYVAPGTQYNGGSWANATTAPSPVGPVGTADNGGIVTLGFTANTSQATTLWLGNSLLGPFSVLAGGVFSNTSGSFTISNTPPTDQFYFITTQAPPAAMGGGGGNVRRR